MTKQLFEHHFKNNFVLSIPFPLKIQAQFLYIYKLYIPLPYKKAGYIMLIKLSYKLKCETLWLKYKIWL